MSCYDLANFFLMESLISKKKLETNTNINSIAKPNPSFEVIVVEDNHLTNTILCKALNSTISTIQNFKNIIIKFSSFQNGSDFLTYLNDKDLHKSKLIVFSDYYLEDDMNGSKILRSVKQKSADATVIIMSDSTNQQISVDTVKMGAYCFLPKDNKTPVICSELLFQMVN